MEPAKEQSAKLKFTEETGMYVLKFAFGEFNLLVVQEPKSKDWLIWQIFGDYK